MHRSTIALNGGAVAVDCQRREPLEPARTPTGQSRSDGSGAASTALPTTKTLDHLLSPDRDGSPKPAVTTAGLDAKRTGGEWDVCQCQEFHSSRNSAATGPSFVEVAARFSLVVWLAKCSPPALAAQETVGSRRPQGAAVPIGTKKMVSLLRRARACPPYSSNFEEI